MKEKPVGVVTHYFGKISVAAIEITEGELKVGDTIHIQGTTSDFTQKVESMQIENQPVEKAVKGDKIGLKVTAHTRTHDLVYLVTG